MNKIQSSDIVQWWSENKEERVKLLTEIGIHAYFISEMRQCCIDSMNQMLIDAATIFSKNNLHYWLDYGGLLGIVRSGELIRYDKDLDIGIFEEDIDKYNSLESQFVDKGYRFSKIDRNKLLSEDDFVPRIHLGVDKKHCSNICACDIFVWQNIRKKEPRKSVMINDTQFCYCDSHYFENTELIDWKGIKLSVPGQTEQYVAMRYGPKWRLADPLYYRNNFIGSA